MGMHSLKTTGLFVVTAVAEIVGSYLPYLWLRQGRSPCLLVRAETQHCTLRGDSSKRRNGLQGC